jgi:hypothetical protein
MMQSGVEKTYRGKFIEASGKEIAVAERQNITVSISMPFFKSCQGKSAAVDSNGIFSFKMPLLNNSVPYTMTIQG